MFVFKTTPPPSLQSLNKTNVVGKWVTLGLCSPVQETRQLKVVRRPPQRETLRLVQYAHHPFKCL